MTVYDGLQVPVGHEKQVQFVTEVLDKPTTAQEVEVEFRRPDASVLATVTLSGGGVYKPAGATEETAPGQYLAKALITSGEPLAVGYAAYGRWRASVGEAFTAWIHIESFEVVASIQSIEAGAPYLATETDVRDWFHNLNEYATPDGLTSTRIQTLLSRNHAIILARLGVQSTGDLTTQQSLIGAQLLTKLTAADLLTALHPHDPEARKTATQWRSEVATDASDARRLGTATRRKWAGLKAVTQK